ncbi:MAG: 50S ribosomal protein L5 [Candidatus Gracilibacteria bacterium]|nr:50S ribosomal protein L5 [Candidatus Gracilibacteria bacterium]
MTKPVDLKTRFLKEIAPELQKTLGLKNYASLPKVTKVTINVGIGSYVQSHNKDYSKIVENITAITGQKPMVAKAKKSISNFKVREGEAIGVMVTLRGKRMYDFLNKMINIVFPRVRDFRGISKKAFDGHGNYSIGLKEHIVFPEAVQDDLAKIHGLQVNISTSAKTNEEGLELLKALGFPFKKN